MRDLLQVLGGVERNRNQQSAVTPPYPAGRCQYVEDTEAISDMYHSLDIVIGMTENRERNRLTGLSSRLIRLSGGNARWVGRTYMIPMAFPKTSHYHDRADPRSNDQLFAPATMGGVVRKGPTRLHKIQ